MCEDKKEIDVEEEDLGNCVAAFYLRGLCVLGHSEKCRSGEEVWSGRRRSLEKSKLVWKYRRPSRRDEGEERSKQKVSEND